MTRIVPQAVKIATYIASGDGRLRVGSRILFARHLGRPALEPGDEGSSAPFREFTRIDERHYVTRIKKNSISRRDGKNTMILPGFEDAIEIDRRLINAGKARRIGNVWHINGRMYESHGETGAFYPTGGEGTLDIDRGTHRALVILKGYNGPTGAAHFRLRKERGIAEEQIEQALWLWNLRPE
ncbi:MAG TPA: hypothetical protein VFQ54_11120 [Thermomicrobiales bacterium]|nr:hypothetical protein [Thermomicrobiales bacterium]